MRVFAMLAAALVAAAALTGCVGGEDAPNKNEDKGDPAKGVPGAVVKGSAPQLTVLAPLSAKVETSAPAWVKSGTVVAFDVTAPSQAKGDVTYTWAVGPLPGTVAVEPVTLDTGSKKGSDYIQPGKNASLKFSTSGSFLMHCHPHPQMLQNVTVIEGLAPSTVKVQIVDGTKAEERRFVPETLVIGVGSTVVYENVGQEPHTATLMTADPPLKQVQASGTSAELTIEGDGWQRVVVAMKDADGRVGIATTQIYVTPELPTFPTKKIEVKYNVGGAPGGVSTAIKDSITFEHNGTLTLNYSVKDAAAANGAPVNEADLEIHLKESGETQDTVTGEGAEGSLTGRVRAATYSLEIIPKGGVAVSGVVTIDVVYDLTPPAPAMKAAADDHGDHGGGGHHH